MKSDLGASRAYIRRADGGPDIGGLVGNVSSAAVSSHGHADRPGQPLEGPGLAAELVALFKMIRRQLWLIIVLTAVLTLASLLVILSLEKEYTATTLLVLDGRNGRLLEPSVANTLAADGEVEILKSDNIAVQVVEHLGLHKDPAFLPEPSWAGQVLSELAATVTSLSTQDGASAVESDRSTRVTGASYSEKSHDSNGGKTQVVDPTVAKALRVFKRQVTIRRRGLTDVIAIDVTDMDPQRAAQYSNAYAEVYLEDQVATKLKGIDRAEAALSRRLAEIDEELKRSETHIGLRQVYQESLGRLKAIAQQRDTVSPDARVASQARPPDVPSFPNRKLFLLLAVLGGSGLAIGAAYLRDMQSRRVRTEGEVEAITGVPIFACLPELPDAKSPHALDVLNGIVDQPGSQYSEAIRTLLFTLQAIVNRGKKLGIILVTSAEEGEGKSTLSVSLARSAAVAGARVVVVDCNLRNPQLHELLGIANDDGLVDLLKNQASEHVVLQRDPRSECMAISSGDIESASPDWLLRSEQIKEVLHNLKSRYDVVILDAPPVGRYADSLLFANAADLVLFTVRSGVARPQVVKSALAQLQRCSEVDVFPILTAHSI
ncbi:Wzz/FepE/Etk N-terminal domain-containing protein [Microvirga sp. CF3062]|uniref:Wzz/FepE/Etk N-terminal domain-containing protein n=1 Tax=Microvirga sp. CF3062 TaxID=3110182 RepID=UPI002E78309D|nr:Wzz/FepE/Etk N-terminal domain-containing protein [Microvirga sp. CF3062]MEE1658402.1 Wzz/FepE/Etk N-terminal domain-containing protein [Microvirga sp. CF3062]